MTVEADDVVAGNVFDKYGSSNPLVRFVVDSFLGTLLELVHMTGVKEVHEVGCGEGYVSAILAERGLRVRASDVSPRIIDQARAEMVRRGLDVVCQVASIRSLNPRVDAAELILCAEVLEHLEDPADALRALGVLARPYALFSVPREPMWRILNLMRLKYVTDAGNTPGHLQHWSKREFVQLLSRHFDIIAVASPFPWTMVLCRARGVT